MNLPMMVLRAQSLSFLFAVGICLSGCSMRDENGNINPAQIRQNVVDAHDSVNTANKALTDGTQAIREGVADTLAEIAKPQAPPTNITQPDR
jgi:hypothetical protein